MLFNAITSTGSAEGLAVSSLVVYDIYRPYINPNATGKQILYLSKAVVVIFGVSMGALAVVLNIIGLSLDFVYLFMGILIGSAVVPLWNMLMWSKANAVGAVTAAWGGMALALATWIIVALAQDGELNLTTLGKNEPMLAGNVVALGSSAVIHTVFSLLKPQNYDFKSMMNIEVLDGHDEVMESIQKGAGECDLEHAKQWILRWGVGFSLFVILVFPVLCLLAGVFSQGFFSFWVFLSLIWGFGAAGAIICLPIFESKEAITGIVGTLFGWNNKGMLQPSEVNSESDDSVSASG
mmetsp:Transcript_39508/g.59709  ORF Transcript_39508/g.59709 Transcript_39508/m.59709 type:complete len:294 (+) Transcript_39508:3-884(+)